MDPVNQRHALEILNAAVQLSEGWSVGDELVPPESARPTPPPSMKRANSGGIVVGGVHRLTLAILLHGH